MRQAVDAAQLVARLELDLLGELGRYELGVLDGKAARDGSVLGVERGGEQSPNGEQKASSHDRGLYPTPALSRRTPTAFDTAPGACYVLEIARHFRESSERRAQAVISR